MQSWPLVFESILREHLPNVGDRELTGDQNLADLGLDSLATVSLLLTLEDTFKVTIPDEFLGAQMFENPANLWATLEKAVSDTRTDYPKRPLQRPDESTPEHTEP